MNDFLSNLVERSLSATGTVRPQLLSIFEPPSVKGGAFFRHTENPELPPAEQHNQEPAERLSRLQSLCTTNPEPATQFVAALSKAALTSPESAELPGASRQVRPRVDLAGRQQSVAPSRERRGTADPAKKDKEGAGALRPQLPSEHTASPSSANKPVPRDPTKNLPHELGAKKIIEMIAPKRDAHRELTQARDVHAVSQRLPSPRPLASAKQPKDPSVAPSINVTIGRVEIRAVPPPAQQRAKPKPTTVLSLEDYLRQRAKGAAQ